MDSFTSAPLSITVRYGAVACVEPVGFTRRAASDPIPFPFPLSNGSDQNHKHTTCEQWKSVRKGKTVNCFQGMNGARAVSHNLRIRQLFRKRTISHLYPAVLLRPVPLRNPNSDSTPKILCALKNASGKNFQRPQGELRSRPAAARCAHLKQKIYYSSCPALAHLPLRVRSQIVFTHVDFDVCERVQVRH